MRSAGGVLAETTLSTVSGNQSSTRIRILTNSPIRFVQPPIVMYLMPMSYMVSREGSSSFIYFWVNLRVEIPM